MEKLAVKRPLLENEQDQESDSGAGERAEGLNVGLAGIQPECLPCLPELCEPRSRPAPEFEPSKKVARRSVVGNCEHGESPNESDVEDGFFGYQYHSHSEPEAEVMHSPRLDLAESGSGSSQEMASQVNSTSSSSSSEINKPILIRLDSITKCIKENTSLWNYDALDCVNIDKRFVTHEHFMRELNEMLNLHTQFMMPKGSSDWFNDIVYQLSARLNALDLQPLYGVQQGKKLWTYCSYTVSPDDNDQANIINNATKSIKIVENDMKELARTIIETQDGDLYKTSPSTPSPPKNNLPNRPTKKISTVREGNIGNSLLKIRSVQNAAGFVEELGWFLSMQDDMQEKEVTVLFSKFCSITGLEFRDSAVARTNEMKIYGLPVKSRSDLTAYARNLMFKECPYGLYNRETVAVVEVKASAPKADWNAEESLDNVIGQLVGEMLAECYKMQTRSWFIGFAVQCTKVQVVILRLPDQLKTYLFSAQQPVKEVEAYSGRHGQLIYTAPYDYALMEGQNCYNLLQLLRKVALL